MKILNTIYDFLLVEYSTSMVKSLITKFKNENPDLEVKTINYYIDRFKEIQKSPNVKEKDITKYTWEELQTVVDSNQPKRIKAGKINDGEPKNDKNLIYDQNGLRIYLGDTVESCVKYGNGYSFCISSRGKDTSYYEYRVASKGTPYFIFDDTKTSERNEFGDFIDPTHLLVLFIYGDEENPENNFYTISVADNTGEEEYETFDMIEKDYPKLKGLKNLFKPSHKNTKEHVIYLTKSTYDLKLMDLIKEYGLNHNQSLFRDVNYTRRYLKDFLNGKLKLYKFNMKSKFKDKHKFNDISTKKLVPVDKDINKEIRDILESYGIKKSDMGDFDVTYREVPFNIGELKSYFEDLKELIDQYNNTLTKISIEFP